MRQITKQQQQWIGLFCYIDWGFVRVEDPSVRVGPYSVIGTDGFGFEVEDETVTKPKYKIPLDRKTHTHDVIIGNGVEIGSNCCIDRGSWRDTVIGEGTKIDSHVKIAHNVIINKHCLIVAGTVIGGSVTIGDNCFLGMNCAIKQRVKIGNNVTVGAAAVVINDVPDGTTVIGVPAKPIRT